MIQFQKFGGLFVSMGKHFFADDRCFDPQKMKYVRKSSLGKSALSKSEEVKIIPALFDESVSKIQEFKGSALYNDMVSHVRKKFEETKVKLINQAEANHSCKLTVNLFLNTIDFMFPVVLNLSIVINGEKENLNLQEKNVEKEQLKDLANSIRIGINEIDKVNEEATSYEAVLKLLEEDDAPEENIEQAKKNLECVIGELNSLDEKVKLYRQQAGELLGFSKTNLINVPLEDLIEYIEDYCGQVTPRSERSERAEKHAHLEISPRLARSPRLEPVQIL